MSERGPELQRFTGSASEQRALARVRAVAGAVALLGSLAVMMGRVSVPVFLIALLGLAMSVAWLRQARKLSRQARTAKPPALVIYRAGFMLDEPTRSVWVPFRDVERIEVDEERLDITVARRDAETLHIEPQYPGVDISTLVRTLHDALGTAREGRHDGDDT